MTPGAGLDVVLDALAEWDESYRRGEDRPLDTFGIADPILLEELRKRIERQKRLYSVLKLVNTVPQAPTQAAAPLPSFPGYETESTIGRGGMGLVYKARDLKLNRVVAVKALAWADHASRGQIDRFLAEAEAIARLKHPNVIPIYAIGEHDGRPYYTLEYAAGGSLSDRLAHGPMAAAQSAELLETLAVAVHAAHSAGIVHRDLKPSTCS
jgi:serine/threonine-protein kinase